MEQNLILKCECGQETEFVRKGDKLHYAERHGKVNEPGEMKCFNCHKLLATPVSAEPEPVKSSHELLRSRRITRT
ncbi:MAG: hypothetical protein ABSG22_10625 [Sedimentisphaerales bacterium]